MMVVYSRRAIIILWASTLRCRLGKCTCCKTRDIFIRIPHSANCPSGGGWSCMLLLHPTPTCTDAVPDLCTLHPDLCTLCLQWLSLAATYGGGVSPSAVGTKTPLAHVVVSSIATCAGGGLPSTHWCRCQTCTALGQLALCGGG